MVVNYIPNRKGNQSSRSGYKIHPVRSKFHTSFWSDKNIFQMKISVNNIDAVKIIQGL